MRNDIKPFRVGRKQVPEFKYQNQIEDYIPLDYALTASIKEAKKRVVKLPTTFLAMGF